MLGRIILTSMLALMTLIGANAQYYGYSYPRHEVETTSVSVGVDYMLNFGSGDEEFGQNYFGYKVDLSHYFSEKVGLGASFTYSESTNSNFYKSHLYRVGIELLGRLTNYMESSPVDVEVAFGISYVRYDFNGSMRYDYEGVDYISPHISLPISFNLNQSKQFRFVVTPSYRFHAQTNRIYYDDGCEVDANISGFGLSASLQFTF